MSRIFINYRREDAATSVGRLADSLGEHLPHVQIFQDISSIEPGADFIDALQQALADCAAVLVVIGPKWLSIADRQGRRKLDDPDDWVRQEIVAALERSGVRVFPLLVEGANMPAADELPDALKRLARRQAHELTVRHWAKDVAALAEILKRVPALADEAPAAAAAKATGPATAKLAEPRASPQSTSPPTPRPRTGASPADDPQPAGSPMSSAPGGGSGKSGPDRAAWKPVAAVAAVVTAGLAIWFFNPNGEAPSTATPAPVAPPTATTPPPAVAPAPVAVAPPTPAARPPADGEVFRDCEQCPEMVAVPAGTFMMGSPADEKGRTGDEGPQHRVAVARFALGRTEITVGEFRHFVAASGYKTAAERASEGLSWRNPGFSQDDLHPVVVVTWNDALAYVKWLAETTAKAYRLPSESEWEYAARAGTQTAYPWGDEPDSNRANFNESGSQWSGKQIAPVGSFDPNAFGLYDMIGNVWEWTQDCWNDSYKGAPADGRVWASGACGRRVVRGGSWYYVPGSARAAFRYGFEPGSRLVSVGFRLARTL